MRVLSVNVGRPQLNPWEPDLLPRLLVADALPEELKDLAAAGPPRRSG